MAQIRSDRSAARRQARAERLIGARREPQQPAGVPDQRRSNFVFESWAELKKVEWPGQSQVVQGTFVVIIACLVVGVFLYVNDKVWSELVTKVLLK
jgi:preprotein translocase SecE subunit